MSGWAYEVHCTLRAASDKSCECGTARELPAALRRTSGNLCSQNVRESESLAPDAMPASPTIVTVMSLCLRAFHTAAMAADTHTHSRHHRDRRRLEAKCKP